VNASGYLHRALPPDLEVSMAKRSARPFFLCVGMMVFLDACSAGGSSSGPPARTQLFDPASSPATQLLRIRPSPPPRQRRPAGPGWLSAQAATGNDLIYVADDNEVVIFPKRGQDPRPIGKISDGVTSAYGLFIDPAKNLYVCNQSENNVTVYPPGAVAPSITYSEGLDRPLYVAADNERVFVGNANDASIAEFKKGHRELRRLLKIPGSEVDGLNFDAAGNLYAAYRGGVGNSGIELFPRGSGEGRKLGMQLNGPQGLVIDASGNILVVETQGTDRVDAFAPGQTKPFATQKVPYVPTQIQLGDGEQRLYISDLNSKIYFSTYPDFRRPAIKIDNSLGGVQGLAVSPPAPP
jgi:DNA-binding beta-propeller fold protein YncE